MNRILCFFGLHDLYSRLIVKGSYQQGVKLIGCRHCDRRYVMSDAHQAFLRYDNDERFKRDLLLIYSNLRADQL